MIEIPSTENRVARLGKWVVLALAGVLWVAWLLNTPEGILGKADAVGYAVCHRIDLRSFHIGPRQMPLCARCSGMYLGALLGVLFQMRQGRRGGLPPKWMMAIYALLAAAFAFDGLNSYAHFFPQLPGLYQPNNTLRLFTGTGMGLALTAFLYPVFNQTLWVDWQPRPAIENLRQLGLLFLLAVGVDLLVMLEIPALLYGLALASVAGVMLVLIMVYTMVWTMLFRLENRFQRFSQTWFPVLGGVTLALLQIALLDLGRFWLTGTWQGFNL